MPPILDELIKLRKALRASAKDVALKMGLNETYVRQIEAGIRPVPSGFLARYMTALEEIHHQDRDTMRHALSDPSTPTDPNTP